MRQLAQPRAAPAVARPRPGPAVGTKTVPFDYLFTFRLTGVPQNRVQDVVSISIEGRFVAVAMGYSVVPEAAGEAQRFEPAPDPAAAREPAITAVLFPGTTSDPVEVTAGSTPPLPLPQVRVVGAPGADVVVAELRSSQVRTMTLTSEGTGQVESPETSLAATFQVIDTTHGVSGPPVEVVRGASGTFLTPTFAADAGGHSLPLAGEAMPEALSCFGTAQRSVELFVIRQSGEVESQAMATLSAVEVEEGLFTGRTDPPLDLPLLRPGDTLGVRYPEDEGSPPVIPATTLTIPRPHPSSVTLGSLAAGLARSGRDLTQGFRLDPAAAPLFTADPPLDELSARQLSSAFLAGCRGADEVSFLYSIDTVGSGRELQSAPIHNVAGLGVADGDRPFRPFAKPVVFEPRSSIRFQIEELGGPAGTLYIVLQGYKVLGTGQPAR